MILHFTIWLLLYDKEFAEHEDVKATSFLTSFLFLLSIYTFRLIPFKGY